MTLPILRVLEPAHAAQFRQALTQAEWVDGVATAGDLSRQVKRNRQLHETDPLAVQFGNAIVDVLERHVARHADAGRLVLVQTTGRHAAALSEHECPSRCAGHARRTFGVVRTVQGLRASVPHHPNLMDLMGYFHNLVRLWADL